MWVGYYLNDDTSENFKSVNSVDQILVKDSALWADGYPNAVPSSTPWAVMHHKYTGFKQVEVKFYKTSIIPCKVP